VLSLFDVLSVVHTSRDKKESLADCAGEKEHCASNGGADPSCGAEWKWTEHTSVGASTRTSAPSSIAWALHGGVKGLGHCGGVPGFIPQEIL